MKIGFDVSQTAGNKAGCGFVADQLVHHLPALDKTNEYLLYPTFYNYRDPSFYKIKAPDFINCRIHFDGMSFKQQVKGWDSIVDDRSEWLGSPDIIHSNNFSCFKDHKAKIVYTLHDVAPLIYPEFTTEENRLVCFDGLFNASLFADHIIATSENTKKSFLHFFPHYPDDRISIVYWGTRPSLSAVSEPDLQKKVLHKFELAPGNFWLGVGTVEPRKNYQLLIDSYCSLNDPKPLVIAGGKGWLESEIYNKLKASGMQDRIKFIGYVSDEQLSVLYSSCFAFIYPSHYEGFGMPVLEAMNCGAAVISSNSSSLPEVGGDAALFIDPKSQDSLVSKMKLLSGNISLHKELCVKSRQQAKQFSWDKAAQLTLGVYEQVVQTGPWMEK